METPGYPKCYYCSSAALQRAPDPPASSDIGDLWAALIRLLFSPAQGCWGWRGMSAEAGPERSTCSGIWGFGTSSGLTPLPFYSPPNLGFGSGPLENLVWSIGLTLLSPFLFLPFEFEKAGGNGWVEKDEAEDAEMLRVKLAEGLLGPGHCWDWDSFETSPTRTAMVW
jgi:hypothetical protein